MTNPEEKHEEKGFDLAQELFDWAESLVKALLFIVLLFTFVVRLISVEGTSMVPTLQDGDYILVSDRFYDPRPGDIVVMTKAGFLADDTGNYKSFVKRIIAVGGQTVNIDFSTGEVFVDGVLQIEPFINNPTYDYGDTQFPLTVPEGEIFVMGDNRGCSTDSRWSMVGTVDERYIVGKVIFRLFPFSTFGKVN